MRRIGLLRFAACGALLILFFAASPRHGISASISYPDLGPIAPGYTFTNIVESSVTSALPLYGTPAPFVIGLSFSPTDFEASITGPNATLTAGQLNYTVVASPGSPGIPLVRFTEGGVYSLEGTGTATTQVSVGAVLLVTITEVDGAPIAPLVLPPVNSSFVATLAANAGTAAPWSLSAQVDVIAGLLGAGYAPGQAATKADVVVTNLLAAVAETLSSAAISKGAFGTAVAVPEPATSVACGVAAAGLAFVRRRSRPGR